MEKKVKEPKIKKFNKKSVLPIVLYVVAGLIGIYSIYTMYTTCTYIGSLVDAGSVVVSEQLSDVVTYFINACLPSVFYAIATWAIGYGVSKLTKIEDLLKSEEK